MSHRPFQRLMTQLALLALALLLVLPTLGRIASAPISLAGARAAPSGHAAMHHEHGAPAQSTPPRHAAMPAAHSMPMDHAMHVGHAMHMDHAMAPHAAVPMAHGSPHAAASRQAPAAEPPHSGHQADCDYCPLLHSLLGALALALLSPPESPLPAPRLRDVAATIAWDYPAGLGSRGPPATL